jgi:selenocysteine lyase/cysteine desulfurase
VPAGPEQRRAVLRAALTAIASWETRLTAHADARLRDIGVESYGQPAEASTPRLGVFSVNVPGVEGRQVAAALEGAGVEAVLGHNGAVRTMKRLAPDRGASAIRLSIAHYNTPDDLDRAIEVLTGCR